MDDNIYPVVFFIHSGNFSSGFGTVKCLTIQISRVQNNTSIFFHLSQGTSQAQPGHVMATWNVVFVSFNYRLGALGVNAFFIILSSLFSQHHSINNLTNILTTHPTLCHHSSLPLHHTRKLLTLHYTLLSHQITNHITTLFYHHTTPHSTPPHLKSHCYTSHPTTPHHYTTAHPTTPLHHTTSPHPTSHSITPHISPNTQPHFTSHHITGFLTTEDEHAPGNFGMWDQVQALEFVKRNILSFRGDPTRVTLMGDEAGSVSVGLHLLSPISYKNRESLIWDTSDLNSVKNLQTLLFL